MMDAFITQYRLKILLFSIFRKLRTLTSFKSKLDFRDDFNNSITLICILLYAFGLSRDKL